MKSVCYEYMPNNTKGKCNKYILTCPSGYRFDGTCPTKEKACKNKRNDTRKDATFRGVHLDLTESECNSR